MDYNRSQILLVPTKSLLLIAACVWCVAGGGVASVGVGAAAHTWTVWMLLAALVVFALFSALFLFISRRHVRRIRNYGAPLAFVLRFFDAPAYTIMMLMIFLGASVRISTFVPDDIIAWFYSGLGIALVLAGVYLLVNFIASWGEEV
jgi:hypothetical protein